MPHHHHHPNLLSIVSENAWHCKNFVWFAFLTHSNIIFKAYVTRIHTKKLAKVIFNEIFKKNEKKKFMQQNEKREIWEARECLQTACVAFNCLLLSTSINLFGCGFVIDCNRNNHMLKLKGLATSMRQYFIFSFFLKRPPQVVCLLSSWTCRK